MVLNRCITLSLSHWRKAAVSQYFAWVKTGDHYLVGLISAQSINQVVAVRYPESHMSQGPLWIFPPKDHHIPQFRLRDRFAYQKPRTGIKRVAALKKRLQGHVIHKQAAPGDGIVGIVGKTARPGHLHDLRVAGRPGNFPDTVFLEGELY